MLGSSALTILLVKRFKFFIPNQISLLLALQAVIHVKRFLAIKEKNKPVLFLVIKDLLKLNFNSYEYLINKIEFWFLLL